MYNKLDHIVGAYSEDTYRGFSSAITYSCPCGKGYIIEEHRDRNHSVDFLCEECKKVYDLDLSDGTYLWFLKEKKKNG